MCASASKSLTRLVVYKGEVASCLHGWWFTPGFALVKAGEVLW